MTARNLADVLETMAAITQSMMDSSVPSDEKNDCPMCLLPATQTVEHDPDCAYRLARTAMSPMDVAEVRRLVRVLRYSNGAA